MKGLRTPLCERLGIEVPVVQAPIGPASTPELAAAVSGAGGLGMLGVTWMSADDARRLVRRTRELTDRTFGVNVVLAFGGRDQLAACLAEGVRVVSTFWGDPSAVNDQIHASGALHLHTVGSAAEARDAVAAGVDVVVAQGWEAGGHVWGGVATLPLVPQVVDAVDPVPVIAAGGVADGRGLVAVLALGAQAAWLGTRFVAAEEADTHDVYRELVMGARDQDTAHTLCFCDGWPDAPHRVLRSDTVTAWESAGMPASPARPGEGTVVARLPAGEIRRYSAALPTRDMVGDTAGMALYAGQSAGLVAAVQPAAAIVAEIVEQATRVLRAG